MEFKERLKLALEHSRGFAHMIFSEITTDDDWIRRPVSGSNHALWIAGHLGYATNAFIGLVDPTAKLPADEYSTLFGKGTFPQDDLAVYPEPAKVFEFWAERSAAFIALLERCDESDLQREVPKGPAFMHDVGAVFQMSVWHEALHAGQLTVIHRMLGQSAITER